MKLILLISLTAFAMTSISFAAKPAPDVSYLDNGQIRLGVNLSLGGAVTYLSESAPFPSQRTPPNMINSFDWGRQVQMSFYSGPVPFKPEGTTLSKHWEGLGWNPIQSGDAFDHVSGNLEHRNDGKSIYVRCVPKIWPLDNVPAECTFETTYTLVGKTVEATCRLNNARKDTTQYSGRAQELPALYTNGAWYKLVSYLGDQPFTDAATTTIVDRNDGKGWPWVSFFSPEHWAALVDANDHGVGMFNPEAFRISGGFAGAPKGSGGPKDAQTGYIAPNIDEILDHNITYEYHYVLIIDTIAEIRRYAREHTVGPTFLSVPFQSDRQHWTYENTTDAGWPIRGELRVNLGRKNAAMLSPLALWHADTATKLRVEAAFETPAREIRVMIEPFTDQERRDWLCWGPGSHRPAKQWIGPITIPITGDGQFRTYEADLTKTAAYRGAMIRLKLLLPEQPGTARLKRIELSN